MHDRSQADGTGACSCSLVKYRTNSLGMREEVNAGCPVQAHIAGLRAVAFSPCGQRLATGGFDHAVILWDAKTGKADQVMRGHITDVRSVSFSADGTRLASGSSDGSIHIWDATGALLRTIQRPQVFPIPRKAEGFVQSVQFSTTDVRRLASMGHRKGLKQWDVASGEQQNAASRSRVEGRKFAVFSPDGLTIATASDQTHSVLLFDVSTGEIRPWFSGGTIGHRSPVTSASWSVDGRKLASVYGDGTCRVWDSSTGRILRNFENKRDSIFSVSRGRDWVEDTQRALALAMGQHPRLGAGSQLLGLDEELLRMILDRVTPSIEVGG